MKLDNVDREILRHLLEDARKTYTDIAKELGVSPGTIHVRVKKLEKNGVIESYHAKLNKQEIGLGVSTFVHVALISHRKGIVDSFVDQIVQIPEVVIIVNVVNNK